jgi:transposase
MANVIGMEQRSAILGLWRRKWSRRRIARTLGLNRRTVAGYIEQHEGQLRLKAAADSNCTIVPPGKHGSKCTIPPAGNGDAKPSIPPAGKSGRQSQCEPYSEQIELALEKGLQAQRIWQDLVCDYGFEGSYDSVKRYVRQKRAASPKRIWRMETLPGEEAQVDFGTGAWIKGSDGRKRRSWIFRTVLSCSRKGYCEAVFSQNAETFIRCLENAFRHFGGVVQTLCIDNLRAAVSRADWYEPEINPKLESFARHYGTVILPCRVRKPEHKGKVESSVKYVKNNALKGREFTTLAEENKHLLWWEDTVADCRIHGTTRQQVRKRFIEIEKPALLPLPVSLFPCFQEGQRKVHRDSYVEVDGSYYEVPCEYIGRQVWVRWDDRTVRVFNRDIEHLRSFAKRPRGQFSHSLGARGRRTTTMEHDMAWWIKRCARMGNNCGLWAIEIMAEKDARGIRVLQGLIGLKKKHSNMELDKACELALGHSAFRLQDIKGLLKRPQKQESFEFMDKHPLIREMCEYTAFLDMLHPDEQVMEVM